MVINMLYYIQLVGAAFGAAGQRVNKKVNNTNFKW